jgi:hypothetical protein
MKMPLVVCEVGIDIALTLLSRSIEAGNHRFPYLQLWATSMPYVCMAHKAELGQNSENGRGLL